jgi:DNA-binding transcriptional MerR regulator
VLEDATIRCIPDSYPGLGVADRTRAVVALDSSLRGELTMGEPGRNRMDDLLAIGRFSRMSRLSIKALRLYDEQELLIPSWVDPSSGYRYYRASQAGRAEAIRILRMVDMPLDEIRELLVQDDPAFTTKRLAMHREKLAERLADQERMLRFLERLIDRGGTIMPYDITTKQAPDQRVASFSMATSLATIGDDIAAGFATLMSALAQAATQPVR